MKRPILTLRSFLARRGNTHRRFTPEVTPVFERFGSDYGGWEVVTDELTADSVVYSFGIGEDASFDVALMERFGVRVHAFDPTPRSIEWVKEQNFDDRFVMHHYGISACDGEVAFYPPENPNYVSHTVLNHSQADERFIRVPVRRLSSIMEELGHDRIDILKMDIEGAEYEVLEDVIDSGIRPRQVLVEFHDRFFGVSVEDTEHAVKKLRLAGYALFSVAPSGQEMCFLLGGSN